MEIPPSQDSALREILREGLSLCLGRPSAGGAGREGTRGDTGRRHGGRNMGRGHLRGWAVLQTQEAGEQTWRGRSEPGNQDTTVL